MCIGQRQLCIDLYSTCQPHMKEWVFIAFFVKEGVHKNCFHKYPFCMLRLMFYNIYVNLKLIQLFCVSAHHCRTTIPLIIESCIKLIEAKCIYNVDSA